MGRLYMWWWCLLLYWVGQCEGTATVVGSAVTSGSTTAITCNAGFQRSSGSWSGPSGFSPLQFNFQCPSDTKICYIKTYSYAAGYGSTIYNTFLCGISITCCNSQGKMIYYSPGAGTPLCDMFYNNFVYARAGFMVDFTTSTTLSGLFSLGWGSQSGVRVTDTVGVTTTLGPTYYWTTMSTTYKYPTTPSPPSTSLSCPQSATTGGTQWYMTGVFGNGDVALDNIGITCQQDCSPCPAGSFSSTASTLPCTLCPLGTWGTAVGSSSQASACPNQCPAGTYGTQLGCTNQACACQGKCQCGYWGNVLGGNSQASACPNACPLGTYSSTLGSTSSAVCLSCPLGTYAGVTGRCACTPCSTGSYMAIQGASVCTLCSPGTITSAGGLSQCSLCAAGTYGATSGMSVCQQCPISYYTSGDGLTLCTLCPIGTNATIIGTVTCPGCTLVLPANALFVYLCGWVCNTGYYASVGPYSLALYVLDAGSCLPCSNSSQCAAGQYRPLCTNGLYNNATCSGKCNNKLPSSKAYYSTPSINNSANGCDWACNAGYFKNQSMGNCSTCQTQCPIGQFITFVCSSPTFVGPVCQSCKNISKANFTGQGLPGNASSCPFSCVPGFWLVNGNCTAWKAICPTGWAWSSGTPTTDANCTVCPLASQPTIYVYTQNTCSFGCGLGYQNVTGDCQQCSAGTYKNTVGNASCTLCPLNYYQPSTYSTNCLIVPSNSVATADRTFYVCNTGYYYLAPVFPATVGSCAACLAGQYLPTASSTCLPCSAGYYSAAASSACSACVIGKYSSSTSSSMCLACPAGQYSGAAASTACLVCNAGYFSAASSGSCTACPAGQYSGTASSGSCTVCPAGQYSAASTSTMCSTCGPGTASAMGSSSCTGCVSGSTYADGYGRPACSPCLTTCALGYSLSLCTITMNSACSACQYPASTIYLYTLNTCSFNCKAGYQITSGSCAPCSVGYYGLNNVCMYCKEGVYQDQTASSACLSCAAGTYQNNWAVTVCTQCGGGLYTPSSGSSICTACTNNFYSTATGVSVCSRCATGSVSGMGATYCYPSGSLKAYVLPSFPLCSAGYYNQFPSFTVCKACAAGTFSTGYGMVDTVEWPSGSYSWTSAMNAYPDCLLPNLDANGAWCIDQSVSLASSYIQLDLGSQQTVVGIVTQGHPTSYWFYWTTSLAITSSLDGAVWTAPVTYGGNTDRYTRQVTPMTPLVARALRLSPLQFYIGMGIRWNALVQVTVCSTCPGGTYAKNISTSVCSTCTQQPPANGVFSVGCSWLCNAGYYVMSSACARCSDSSACTAGQFRPNCTDGLTDAQTCSGVCVNKAQSPQSIYLGPSTDNSNTNCPWGCNAGYYRNISNMCVSCQLNCSAGYYPSTLCLVPQNLAVSAPTCLPCAPVPNAVFMVGNTCPFNCTYGSFLQQGACVLWSANCSRGYAWSPGTNISDRNCTPCSYTGQQTIYVYALNTCNFTCTVGYMVSMIACQACAAGKYKASNDRSQCVGCWPMYQPSTAMGFCLAVPANGLANSQGTGFTCNAGYYYSTSDLLLGPACQPCTGFPVANTLSVQWSGCNLTSLSCNAGYYRNWTQLACLACPSQPPANSVAGLTVMTGFCATCSSVLPLQDKLMACPFVCNMGYYQQNYTCTRCSTVTCITLGMYAQMCTGALYSIHIITLADFGGQEALCWTAVCRAHTSSASIRYGWPHASGSVCQGTSALDWCVWHVLLACTNQQLGISRAEYAA